MEHPTRRRIPFIVPIQRFKHDPSIDDGFGEDTDGIEGMSIGDETVPGDAAVTGFEPVDPAVRGGEADGTTGVGAEGATKPTNDNPIEIESNQFRRSNRIGSVDRIKSAARVN